MPAHFAAGPDLEVLVAGTAAEGNADVALEMSTR